MSVKSINISSKVFCYHGRSFHSLRNLAHHNSTRNHFPATEYTKQHTEEQHRPHWDLTSSRTPSHRDSYPAEILSGVKHQAPVPPAPSRNRKVSVSRVRTAHKRCLIFTTVRVPEPATQRELVSLHRCLQRLWHYN